MKNLLFLLILTFVVGTTSVSAQSDTLNQYLVREVWVTDYLGLQITQELTTVSNKYYAVNVTSQPYRLLIVNIKDATEDIYPNREVVIKPRKRKKVLLNEYLCEYSKSIIIFSQENEDKKVLVLDNMYWRR